MTAVPNNSGRDTIASVQYPGNNNDEDATLDLHSDKSINEEDASANQSILKSVYASMGKWLAFENPTHAIVKWVILGLSIVFTIMIFISCCCCASRKVTLAEVAADPALLSGSGRVSTNCKCFSLATLFFLLGSVTALFSVLMIFKNMWLQQLDKEEEDEEKAFLVEGVEPAESP